MLELNKVSKSFNKDSVNEKRIFKNLNLHIKKGEFVVIIGSNGSGKSTLMNLISGVLRPNKGKVFLDGKDISNDPEYIRSRTIGRVFQDPLKGTASEMRVYENLALACKRRNKMGLKRCISKDDISKFKNLLEPLGLGLETCLNTKVGLLSGGQRQALTLLMAVAKKPKLLLLDEHTSALDPKAANTILTQTDKIVKSENITTLMITHNMNDALKFGDRLIMLVRGNIVLDVNREEKEKLKVEDLLEKFTRSECSVNI